MRLLREKKFWSAQAKLFYICNDTQVVPYCCN